MGNTFLMIGQYSDAIDCYEEAISIQDDIPKYWLHKGIVYEAMIAKIEKDKGPQLNRLDEDADSEHFQDREAVRKLVSIAKETYY